MGKDKEKDTKASNKVLVWTAMLDTQLPKMVRTHGFDFTKVAEELAKQEKVAVTADQVRKHFAEIKKREQKKVPVKWSVTVDQQLQKLCRSNGFDFEKASEQLAVECGYKTTAEACRIRFAELRKIEKEQKEQKAQQKKEPVKESVQEPVQENPAEQETAFEWNDAQDKLLQKCVKKFAFDFDKVAAGMGVDSTICRQRFAVLRKKNKTPAATATGAGSAAATATTERVAWTASLDEGLKSSVKANMFNFTAVSSEILAALTAAGSKPNMTLAELEVKCRERFMELRPGGKKSKKSKHIETANELVKKALGLGLAPEAQAAVAAYPLAKNAPPPKHLSWEQLESQACASSLENCRYAPKNLPSLEDPAYDNDEDSKSGNEENAVVVAGEAGAAKTYDGVKPLSRTDILEEIAMGKLGNLDAMD